MIEQSNKLIGTKIAILATDGFEESELTEPYEALKAAGAEVQVISINAGTIRGWKDNNWSKNITVDNTLTLIAPSEFDALVLPGGVINPDKLRIEKNAIRFIQDFVSKGKPIAAICHGPQTLIEANAVEGRRMTSWLALKTDLMNAGAIWVDEEVVVDQGLITSRSPADIPAFNRKMIEEFAFEIHNRSTPGAEGFSVTL